MSSIDAATSVSDRERALALDVHHQPGFALVYLVFAFVPLLFMPRAALPAAAGATLITVALFLPLHFGFYRCSPRLPRPTSLGAVALLGFALIPFNPSGNTFLIYAVAMAAAALPPRHALALAFALGLLMTLEYFLVIPDRRTAGAVSGITATIGAVVMAGIGYARRRAREMVQLQLSQDEVRRLATLAERERIGRDLHDLLGHTLSVVALKSELAGRLIERDPIAARQQISDVEQVAREALTQVRDAVTGIRASGLLAELASARHALLAAEVRLDQHLAPVALDTRTEQALAFALREAVTNVVRHAAAQRVDVDLVNEGPWLRLSIADDGRGGIARNGHGLGGMRERIEALGGSLAIDSPQRGGTRLTLRVPRPPHAHAHAA